MLIFRRLVFHVYFDLSNRGRWGNWWQEEAEDNCFVKSNAVALYLLTRACREIVKGGKYTIKISVKDEQFLDRNFR